MIKYTTFFLLIFYALHCEEIDWSKEHPKILSFMRRGNPEKFSGQESAAPWLCLKCGVRNHASEHRCRSCGAKKEKNS